MAILDRGRLAIDVEQLGLCPDATTGGNRDHGGSGGVLQLKDMLPLLPQEAILVFDRGYDAIWFWCQRSGLSHKGTLIRLKSNRCLYRKLFRLDLIEIRESSCGKVDG